jgi:hypothetical protein
MSPAAPESAARSPGDLLLFVHALRLAWMARNVGYSRPVARLVDDLNALPLLPREVEPAAAVRAASRACVRLHRWAGGLDSCLTRSLVAGALLSDRDEVLLHLGLVPPGEERDNAVGHAWLSVSGEIVEPKSSHDSSEFPEMLRLTMRRRR